MHKTPLPSNIRGRGCLKVAGQSFTASLWRADIPSEKIEEHSHESGHFVLALDAGYISEAVAGDHHAPPLTLIYSPPGVVHRDRCGTLGDRFMIVEVDDSLTSNCAFDPVWVRDTDALDAAVRIVGSIASRRGDEPDEALGDGVLTLVEKVCRTGVFDKVIPDWTDDAFDALRDLSSRSDLRIAHVAQQVGVHPVHLSRAFRQRFGCSPSVALRRFRVWRAAASLSEGEGLAQIAHDCGFADQSHLTRSFSQTFGTTPGRFREAFA